MQVHDSALLFAKYQMVSLTVHAALLFLLFPLHALPLRKHTPAIILPIQPIFMGKFYRPLISVLFLEIRRKMLHFIDLCKFLAYLIDLSRIFKGLMESVVVK